MNSKLNARLDYDLISKTTLFQGCSPEDTKNF